MNKSTRMKLRGHLNRKEIEFEENEHCIAYCDGEMPVRCFFDAEGEMTKIEFFDDEDTIDIDLEEIRDRQKKHGHD